MSRLTEVIAELCPDGVKWEKVGDLCEINTGIQLNKEMLSNEGTYPVYNGGIYPSGYHNEFNSEAHTIAISQGGASAGFVNFVETQFWAGAHCYVITHVSTKILNRYLYFFLKNNQEKIQNSKHGAGIPGLRSDVLNNIRVPLLPLPVQEEIVRILNQYSAVEEELEAKLQAELNARTKQYDYYRDFLLSFNDYPNVKTTTIGKVAECLAGATPNTTKKEYWENGTISWMSSGEVNLGQVYKTEKKITQLGYDNCSTKMVPENTVVIALAGQGKTRGMVAITRIPVCTNQSLCSIITNKEVNSDYLYYYLQTQYQNLRVISSGDGTRGGLNLKMIKKYSIPIPPLAEQERIVSILNRYDKLVNDLRQKLQTEKEARRKQYEYYRDRLLTFKELQA